MEVTTVIPGLRQANKLLADIKTLGIYDVEPMYDSQVKLWAICQNFKPSGKILLMNDHRARETGFSVMWWCRDPDTLEPRMPSDRDLHDIIVTVKRAQVWFDKGSDYMVDKLEKEEQDKHDKNRQAQSEKIRSFAPDMKKAIKKELL